ncbi:hypothetical protein CBOM_07421 [Ceraceosorus bombacis]|uniref:Uncharacterized protein n=1 Tax=Ceraceosorus bombacis TaxID=401625 RepID=A0A0N7L9C1_9BASI|nr:hypothetical protein CBOM_07421 [Ceraceosorus bombacis]
MTYEPSKLPEHPWPCCRTQITTTSEITWLQPICVQAAIAVQALVGVTEEASASRPALLVKFVSLFKIRTRPAVQRATPAIRVARDFHRIAQ